MAEEELTSTETMKKEKKERKNADKKKSKKRKKPDDPNDSDESTDNVKSKDSHKEGKIKDKIPKKKKKKDVKSRLKSKKEEMVELMKKIPLTNEDGIAFTKFQIRQMMKRVKKGLEPVATAKELDEKRQNDARLRREEEAELAGLASTRNSPDSDEDNDDHSKNENSDGDNVNHDEESIGDTTEANLVGPNDSCRPVPSAENNSDEKKKAKRNKPIPSDYVCQACKNRHTPAHWIYDCPDKVTVRGTNKKKKRERGMNDPDSKKVFVSGLPFDVKAKAVEDFFSVTNNCGTVAFVRLVKFDDTKRCNGQAYVSFDTDAGAQRAIKLSGTTLDSEAFSSSGDNNSKKKNGESPEKRKELKLKVSKVLNRRKTKRG